ncbi:cyclin-like protein, partial [Leucosporidium creatinivorum]
LNPLAPLGQPTPSQRDGVPEELERDLRAYGALLIQQAGVMLKAPQVVMATAQVLFQRFWFVTSMKHFGIKDIGLAALFLASKLEESPLRIRDLINCYSYLLELVSHCSKAPYPPPTSFTSYVPMDYFANEFYDTKEALVIAEMQILKRLAFQTQCGLPYGHLVNYLKVLELTDDDEFVARCWGYVNDMLQTPAPALYPQTSLAIAAIYLSTRVNSPPIALPLSPVPWWTLFDTTEDEILDVCGMLLKLYQDWGKELTGTGEKMGVWRKAAGLPIDKKGVRERIEGAAHGNGRANGDSKQ